MSAARALLPTDAWVRALLAPALVLIATGIDRNYQTDLWHHLARGRLIAAEGRLVDDDRFTFTVAGEPLRDASWLWQVGFYHLFELGGLPLVQAANSLLLAAVAGLLVLLCWQRSGSLTAACLASTLAVVGLWQVLLIRPQTASLLLFVLTAVLLEAARSRRWLLGVPPALLGLWANLHGGFPVGLALVGCYALGEALEAGWRRALPWAACLAGCVAGTLANPYGADIYRYVLLTTGSASARRIDEWLPPGLGLLIGKVWVASLVLLVVLLARSPARPTWRDVCLLACFLPASAGSARMIAWWLLVCVPVLALLATASWPSLKQLDAASRPGVGATGSVAVLAVLAVLSFPALEAWQPVFRASPDRAHRTESDLDAVADLLAAHASAGRLYTRFAWGEYLGWRLAPGWRVFMDGRIEIIPDPVWAEYQTIARGQGGWQELLDRRGIDALVLDTTSYHGALLPLVASSGRWQKVGETGPAAVYVRRAGGRVGGIPEQRERGGR